MMSVPCFFLKKKKRDQNELNRHLGSKETLQMMVDQLPFPQLFFFRRISGWHQLSFLSSYDRGQMRRGGSLEWTYWGHRRDIFFCFCFGFGGFCCGLNLRGSFLKL